MIKGLQKSVRDTVEGTRAQRGAVSDLTELDLHSLLLPRLSTEDSLGRHPGNLR